MRKSQFCNSKLFPSRCTTTDPFLNQFASSLLSVRRLFRCDLLKSEPIFIARFFPRTFDEISEMHSCVVGVSQKVFTKAAKCVEALYTYRNNNRKVTGIQLPFTSCLRRTLPGFYFYDDEIKNVAKYLRVRPENFFDFGVYTVPINNVVL